MIKFTRVGIDTGGTFTDFISIHRDQIFTHKVLSTPHDPAIAVVNGLRELLDQMEISADQIELVHGSTVATNTLLERNGAKVALITTENFEDLIEIGRQNRTELYNFNVDRPEPLVPRDLRFGISERILHNGKIEIPIELDQLSEIIEKISNCEAIAICLLFSYVNPSHEKMISDRLANLHLPISASHAILPEYREFERFSTTIANAYVQPKVANYVETLEKDLRSPIRIMQSNGGSISTRIAKNEPIRTAVSGPAGGVIGAFEIAKLAGFDRAITFDMGGTSTDVSLCDGEIRLQTESVIGGIPIRVPMIDIHTVGAGGGSVAWIDRGGALQVGPQSAGAEPGPICYGKGDQITVTDANVYLGRLDPENFLGGRMRLFPDRIDSAIEPFAKDLGKTPIELAEGIIQIANAAMERAIRVISVERGFDPRDFALISFGGAGGLHACDLARSLEIPTVIIPPNGGLLSAFGMISADVIRDYSRTVLGKKIAEINQIFLDLRRQAIIDFRSENFNETEIIFLKSVDLRYRGQSFELNVEFGSNFVETFHEAHENRYGYCRRDWEIEIVNLRLRAIGKVEKHFASARNNRRDLEIGDEICGPVTVNEFSSTTFIPSDFSGRVDRHKNLILSQNY